MEMWKILARAYGLDNGLIDEGDYLTEAKYRELYHLYCVANKGRIIEREV